MKTQTHLKTLIAVAVTGLMLTGAAANAQGYGNGRHNDAPVAVPSQPRHDDRPDSRNGDRNDTRYTQDKLRYDRAIVQQVNDLRTQIDHASRARQINRREAAQFQGRLDGIINLKRRYASSDFGLNRNEFNEVTAKLSDLSADVSHSHGTRYR